MSPLQNGVGGSRNHLFLPHQIIANLLNAPFFCKFVPKKSDFLKFSKANDMANVERIKRLGILTARLFERIKTPGPMWDGVFTKCVKVGTTEDKGHQKNEGRSQSVEDLK